MIIDLDQWIREEESADLGERMFPHDIFLSHRRFDLPHAWMEGLSESGIRTV
jgi:TIR domain